MRRWVALFLATAAGAGIVLLLIPSEEDPAPVPLQLTQAQKQKPPRCPKPRVTNLTVRAASEDGYRIRLHVSAEAERARLGGFFLRWGDRSHGGVAFLVKSGARRLSIPLASHRYRKGGTYRVRVTTEAESASCGRMRSEPATLRVRVPLR